MPTLNGVSLTWDETSPADGESAGLGDDRMRSIKSTVRTGLDAEHNWPSAGGSAVGYHVFGSARPFYGAQSTVSSSGTDGRLMMTSDTSRLFGVGSGGTVFLGGPTVLSLGTFPGSNPQRSYWAEEFGQAVFSSGSTLVTIPNSGFSGMPYFNVTLVVPVIGLSAFAQVTAVDASSFVISVLGTSGVFSTSTATVHWSSRGTRTL